MNVREGVLPLVASMDVVGLLAMPSTLAPDRLDASSRSRSSQSDCYP